MRCNRWVPLDTSQDHEITKSPEKHGKNLRAIDAHAGCLHFVCQGDRRSENYHAKPEKS